MNPKLCECGLQGFIVDSRQHDTHVHRRYECRTCNVRWSTCEVRLAEGEHIEGLMKTYSTLEKEIVADKLIALAQEILYGRPTEIDK